MKRARRLHLKTHGCGLTSLEGRLILTPDDGGTYEFKKGDSFIVPKGYTGHWHMPEKYRELIVIDTGYLQSE